MACNEFYAIANENCDLIGIGMSSTLSWALDSLVDAGMPS